MSAFQYSSVNLFVRGVPSNVEQADLAKVLSIYGEMNMKPEAFSVKFRRTNDPKRPFDDLRYDVVLYGFHVNTDPTVGFGHMFMSIIHKEEIRTFWVDYEGKSQYVLITVNNRPIPQVLLDELLWKNSNKETKVETKVETMEETKEPATFDSKELHEMSEAEKLDRAITRRMKLKREAYGVRPTDAEKFFRTNTLC